MSKDLIERARNFAEIRHAGQFRSNKAHQPKIEHLQEVAMLVQKAGGSEAAVAAGWLHDVVEDTPTTLNEVRALFGLAVADLVDGLTDPDDFAPMQLETRKNLQAKRLTEESKDVQLVKLCDQISNVRCVYQDPPSDMDRATCLDYAVGAKKLADICKGISPMLDDLFEEAFNLAKKKYTA